MSVAPMDLYRFFDRADRLLYIGISLSAAQRASEHRRSKAWWSEVARMEIEHFQVTRSQIEQIEREAIRRERPLYNVAHAQAFTVPPCRVCARPIGRRASAIVIVLDVKAPACDRARCFGADNATADLLTDPCNLSGFPCHPLRRAEALDLLVSHAATGPDDAWWVEHTYVHRWAPSRVLPSSAVVLDLDDVLDHFGATE